VVVIPREHADEVAEEAYEATLYEDYAQQRIRNGESIFGIFPATENSMRDYKRWRLSQKDSADV
jgi:regulator of RNase E activity RraA